MKIVTWNINSVRQRQELVCKFLLEHSPDIVCLQETKCMREQFPTCAMEEAGYQITIVGQKAYNGVSILSKHPIKVQHTKLPGYEYEEARFVSVQTGGLHVICVYVPNGQSTGSPAYYKQISFLTFLEKYLQVVRAKGEKIILAGDFNIAPTNADADTLLHKEFICDETLRDYWKKLLDQNLIDIMNNEYTWWDYRWPKIGARIDNVLYSGELDALEIKTITDYRHNIEKPSDHCPVMLTLKNNTIE